MTKQSFKDECDINNIIKKFMKTGLMEHVNRYQGDYSDICAFDDYQTSLNQVIEAGEMFSSLPAKIRSRFGNDPAAFLDFVGDPVNAQEMIDLGLAKPRGQEEAGTAPSLNVATGEPLEAKKGPSRKSSVKATGEVSET